MSRLTKTRRKGRQATDAETLAKVLPEHLRSFQSTTDMAAREADITAWVKTMKLTPTPELVAGIIRHSGLLVMSMFRDQLIESAKRFDHHTGRYTGPHEGAVNWQDRIRVAISGKSVK